MIDLDRNKEAANEGALFPYVSSRLVHVTLYTSWNVTGIPNNVPLFFSLPRVDIRWVNRSLPVSSRRKQQIFLSERIFSKWRVQ